MKKYNSYFNKRYFPDGEDPQAGGEEPRLENSGDNPQEARPETLDDFVPDTPETAFQPEAQSGLTEFTADTYPAVSAPETAGAASAAPGDGEEATIISQSAVISGELTVQGDIHLFGKIRGNVTASGNLEIAGKVIGNVTGNDIELSHCELKGDITAVGFVFMDKDSLMIGNVSSQDITLDGKVKGDIVATRKVYVRSNAVIMGNIKAASIAIDEGAALQGKVIIANQDEDVQISEEKP